MNFKNPEYVRYISDKESYKKVIERYKNKKEGQPLFVFDMNNSKSRRLSDQYELERSGLSGRKSFAGSKRIFVSNQGIRRCISVFGKIL